MSDETNPTPPIIEPGRLALIEKYWEHKKAQSRANTRRMGFIEQMIGQPSEAGALEVRALEASDQEIEAAKQADITVTELHIRFPSRSVSEADEESWGVVVRRLARSMMIAEALRPEPAKETKP
jgi:hypothetical protein